MQSPGGHLPLKLTRFLRLQRRPILEASRCAVIFLGWQRLSARDQEVLRQPFCRPPFAVSVFFASTYPKMVRSQCIAVVENRRILTRRASNLLSSEILRR